MADWRIGGGGGDSSTTCRQGEVEREVGSHRIITVDTLKALRSAVLQEEQEDSRQARKGGGGGG